MHAWPQPLIVETLLAHRFACAKGRARQIMAGLPSLRAGNASAALRQALMARLEETAAGGLFHMRRPHFLLVESAGGQHEKCWAGPASVCTGLFPNIRYRSREPSTTPRHNPGRVDAMAWPLPGAGPRRRTGGAPVMALLLIASSIPPSQTTPEIKMQHTVSCADGQALSFKRDNNPRCSPDRCPLRLISYNDPRFA